MSDNIDRSNWSEADHDAESVGQDLVEFATGSRPERTPDLTPDATSKGDEGLAAWIKEQAMSPVFVRWALLALILLAFVVFALSVLGESDEDSPPGTDAAPVYPENELEDPAVAVWGEGVDANDGEQDSATASQDQDAPTSSSTLLSQPTVPVADDFPVPIAPSGKVVEYNDDDQGMWVTAVYPFDQFDQLVEFYGTWLEDEGYDVNRDDQTGESSGEYPSVWFSASGGSEGSSTLSIAVTGDKRAGDVKVYIYPGADIKASP